MMNELREYMDVLRECYLFRKMEEEVREAAVGELGGKVIGFDKGNIICHEGGRLEKLGIVLEGEVRVVRIDLDGNERLFQKLSPSYMLGADVVYTPTKEVPYSVYCSQDTKIWMFPWTEKVREGEGQEVWREEIRRRLTEFIANENVRKFYRIDILSSKNVRTRVLKYLKIQCRKKNSNTVEIPYSREEFANYLCVNRSVLSDELSKMEKEGLLTFKKNRFTLLKDL